MPLTLNKASPRRAFQFGRLRDTGSADAVIDQLTEQLLAARQEIAELRNELAAVRHAAAKEAVTDAFARLQRGPDMALH